MGSRLASVNDHKYLKFLKEDSICLPLLYKIVHTNADGNYANGQ